MYRRDLRTMFRLTKFVLYFGMAAFLLIDFCPAQNASHEVALRKITIRLLNGKTGKPVKNDTPSIWFDDAKSPIFPRMIADGEGVIEVNNSQFREMRIFPSENVDCRYKGVSFDGVIFPKYSLDEIVAQGVVAANVCGKQQTESQPGVLVLYVRPLTFGEVAALNQDLPPTVSHRPI